MSEMSYPQARRRALVGVVVMVIGSWLVLAGVVFGLAKLVRGLLQ